MAFRLCSPSAMPFIEQVSLSTRRQSDRNSRFHRSAELVQPGSLMRKSTGAGCMRGSCWTRLMYSQ